jgi:hypothetical protein
MIIQGVIEGIGRGNAVPCAPFLISGHRRWALLGHVVTVKDLSP